MFRGYGLMSPVRGVVAGVPSGHFLAFFGVGPLTVNLSSALPTTNALLSLPTYNHWGFLAASLSIGLVRHPP